MPHNDLDAPSFKWAQLLPGKASAISEQRPPEPAASDETGEGHNPAAPSEHSPMLSTQDRDQQRQRKMPAELAKMIEMDLARHPDCPQAGFRVTVYGWPRWRAMLTIEPAAGGIRNPQDWRELTQELAERLRKRYDVAWEE